MRKLLLSASVVMLLVSGQALAKKPIPAGTGPVACALADLVPGALACSGFFAGNLLGGSKDKLADQVSGLQALDFDWNGDWGAIDKIDSLNGSKTLDFGQTLYGMTFLGLHFGGGGPTGVGNGTAFYKIDVGSNGLQELALKYQGSSGAVLYRTAPKPVLPPVNGPDGAIPEPATWAMMLGGFGLIGGMLRYRRRANTVVA